MKIWIRCLFLIPLMLFAGTRHFYEDVIENYNSTSMDKIKANWKELGFPISVESKKEFQDAAISWITKKENQSKLVQKIREQIIAGGLDTSEEISLMISELERVLDRWNKVYDSWNYNGVRQRKLSGMLACICCNIKGQKEEVNEMR